MVVDVLCRASTQGGAESQMNTATTLTTDHDRTIIAHKTEAVALQGNIIDRDAGMNGAGVGEDVCFTLNTVDRHGVAYDTGRLTPGEAQEQRCYSADAPAPTLQSRECGGIAGINERQMEPIMDELKNGQYMVWYRRTMSNGNPYYVLKCGMYLRMAVLPIVFDDVFAAALDEIRAGLATAAAIRQQHGEGEENDG